jgi:hypothetical protein
LAFLTEIEDPRVEKHTLVILRPRVRQLVWTTVAGPVWSSPFSLGVPKRCWVTYSSTSNGLVERASLAALTGFGTGFFYDSVTQTIYVGTSGTDPDTYDPAFDGTVPGITIEYEIYLSSKEFVGPSDPLNGGSAVVEWLPVLTRAPIASQGNRDALYGFLPLDETSIEIANQDGWLNAHLHSSSFRGCIVKTYILADDELEHGVTYSNTRQVFIGYTGESLTYSDETVTIPTVDFLKILDQTFEPQEKFSVAEFPSVDPNAVLTGKEYWIRVVRGMVEDHVPVNIDYATPASTTNNRDWVTHEGDPGDGSIQQIVDDAAPNTNTRTYLTAVPKVNVGDSIILTHSGVPYYTIVQTVNRASNYIEHNSLGGRVIISGDTLDRYYVGRVSIKDDNGLWFNLLVGQHYNVIDKTTLGNNPNWLGFRLIGNFEATFPTFTSPFDPSKHDIVARVYGTEVLDQYSDLTDVGSVTDFGGVASEAVSLLYYILRGMGIQQSEIDEPSFKAATSHSLGIAIPAVYSNADPENARDIVSSILQSMIWRLGYVDSSGSVKIGLFEVGPLVPPAAYEASEDDTSGFQFEHEYNDVYSDVIAQYMKKEKIREGDTVVFYGDPAAPSRFDSELFVVSHNYNARDLHAINRVFNVDLLQYMLSEAQIIADRYGFALGERRGIYTVQVGQEFIPKSNINASYDLIRKKLPGFTFDKDIDRTRQLMLTEVHKSSRGATIVLEDQKGIQDNSGDW